MFTYAYQLGTALSSIKRSLLTIFPSTKSSINQSLSTKMKFTSILFTLVASLFLIDSTFALPAPKCRKLCQLAKKLDLAKIVEKAKALATHPLLKTALGVIPGGATAQRALSLVA
jgi:hypothetical protein